MKIKLLDYGYIHPPKRAHSNDAGADVYLNEDITIMPNDTITVSLGFGIALPDGFAGFIFPRSSLAKQGIICELPPIDSGYNGAIHAIVTNHTKEPYQLCIGDRIGQLVITPVILADFVSSDIIERGQNAFGSTGR